MASFSTSKIRHLLRLAAGVAYAWGRPKIFCIGRNKTGTTSLAKALVELDFTVGEQNLAERLVDDWARRDFQRLFLYCYTAQAFQDVPFSLPFTFQSLDQRFPGSKFILTMRDSPEQWYRSVITFVATLFGGGDAITADHLRRSVYVQPGWAYQAYRLIYSTPDDGLLNKDVLIASYNAHNAAVMEYFRHRPGDLLVLNISASGAYDRLCDFLKKPCTGQDFPWENKTSDWIEKKMRGKT